ncbi:MAG: hypothetical protein AMXMBFR4_09720 [Candidatus Hydrogenedentota bacterium]
MSQNFKYVKTCIIASLLVGCAPAPKPWSSDETQREKVPTVSAKASNSHHHEAPHGGTLVMLGDHVGHVELVLDTESGVLTAYVLDGEAERPVRIGMPALRLVISPDSRESFPLELSPVADPLSGETAGDTSVFRIEDERLQGLAQFRGSLQAIEIRGITLADVAFSFPEGNE